MSSPGQAPDPNREARHRSIRNGKDTSVVPKGWDPDAHLAASRGAGFSDGYRAGFDAAMRQRQG